METNLWRQYLDAKARTDRVSKMINDRARATCKAAGLDPTLLGIHPHNAMVDYKYGHPWRNVDYSLVRKTLWLLGKQFEPSRIVERWYSKHDWQTEMLPAWDAYRQAERDAS